MLRGFSWRRYEKREANGSMNALAPPSNRRLAHPRSAGRAFLTFWPQAQRWTAPHLPQLVEYRQVCLGSRVSGMPQSSQQLNPARRCLDRVTPTRRDSTANLPDEADRGAAFNRKASPSLSFKRIT
jgi:hypothetical protein